MSYRDVLHRQNALTSCTTVSQVRKAVSAGTPWSARLVFQGENPNTLQGFSNKWWSIESLDGGAVAINHGAVGRSGRSTPFVKSLAEGLEVLNEKLAKGYVFDSPKRRNSARANALPSDGKEMFAKFWLALDKAFPGDFEIPIPPYYKMGTPACSKLRQGYVFADYVMRYITPAILQPAGWHTEAARLARMPEVYTPSSAIAGYAVMADIHPSAPSVTFGTRVFKALMAAINKPERADTLVLDVPTNAAHVVSAGIQNKYTTKFVIWERTNAMLSAVESAKDD